MERATRIELAFSAWEADVLPLNYARETFIRLAEHLAVIRGALVQRPIPKAPRPRAAPVSCDQLRCLLARPCLRVHATRIGIVEP